LRKEVGAPSAICGRLQFETAKGIKRFQFLLLEYRFFKDSEKGSALPLNLPRPLSPLSLVLHIAKSHALVLLKLPCYFVKLETRTVGLFATQGHRESLLVASLGVAKEYRRLGIGTCILNTIERLAKRMGKRWLEVDVLKKNVPARRVYSRFGFTFIYSERRHNVIRGKKPL